MPSKFFGNRFDKGSNKKSSTSKNLKTTNKIARTEKKSRSDGGVRKDGRGSQYLKNFKCFK